jgi:16S rRNA (guanine1207-N2)-methyltransferase
MVTLTLPGLTVELATDRGVFSADRVDKGTKLLLVEMSVLGTPQWPAGDLVDVGCGYGPIAVTLARAHPDRTVWAVEPNERARDLCRSNAATLGLGDQVRVVAPDEVPADLEIAAFVSNPPIRIGKPALHGLLTEWLARLVDGGEAWLVVQRNLGADSLATWLGAAGVEVERVASRRGYRILRVRAGVPGPPGDEAVRVGD